MRCRVVGNLGQVESVNGVVNITIDDPLVTIYGNFSVIGRSVVVSMLIEITPHYTSMRRLHCLDTHTEN